MNPSPITSPIASPVLSPNPTSPFQAALAAQIGVLTHSVDRLEQLAVVVPVYHDSIQNEIDAIHSTIDGLNALYEADLNDASEERRAKWLLRDILRDLPDERDWMNPDTERSARALVGN